MSSSSKKQKISRPARTARKEKTAPRSLLKISIEESLELSREAERHFGQLTGSWDKNDYFDKKIPPVSIDYFTFKSVQISADWGTVRVFSPLYCRIDFYNYYLILLETVRNPCCQRFG